MSNFEFDKKKNFIYNYFNTINITLSKNQVNQFIKYYELLNIWNKKIDLTTIVDFEDVVIKHFIDSSYISKFINFNYKSIIDVGTGGGFPGIPLKIIFPESNILLLDSLSKRINFLNIVIEELNLKDIKAIHNRAEELAHNEEYRESFDISISRAVANLSTLSEYCLPFLKNKGIFISYKSLNINEEIDNAKKALNILSSSIEEIYNYNLPNTDIGRSLLLIRKDNNIDKKYPRLAGKPSKKPLWKSRYIILWYLEK